MQPLGAEANRMPMAGEGMGQKPQAQGGSTHRRAGAAAGHTRAKGTPSNYFQHALSPYTDIFYLNLLFQD